MQKGILKVDITLWERNIWSKPTQEFLKLLLNVKKGTGEFPLPARSYKMTPISLKKSWQ